MDRLTGGIRKFVLAGVGAAATTAEKSQEIFDDLIEKGELTVEQGKALNEELKHNIKNASPEEKAESIIGKLSEEELEALKAKLV